MVSRLIYISKDLNCTFELSAARTVIGRRPYEIEHLAKVHEQGDKEGFLQLSHRGTTFVILSKDILLARTHFEIIRLGEEQGLDSYFIRDLDSHCGIYINGDKAGSSSEWVRLQGGDKIQTSSSSFFEFSVSN